MTKSTGASPPDSVDGEEGTFALRFSLAQLTRVLLGAVAAVVTIGIINKFFDADSGWALRINNLLELNREESFPTWFNAVLLFSCAMTLVLITVREFRLSRPLRWNWLLFALVLMAVSIDEITGIHESLGTGIGASRQGLIYFTWVVPGAAVAITFLVLELRLFLRLPRTIAISLFIAGAIYVMGALGMEMLTGLYVDTNKHSGAVYETLTVFEEGGELLGAALVLRALFKYIRNEFGGLTLTID